MKDLRKLVGRISNLNKEIKILDDELDSVKNKKDYDRINVEIALRLQAMRTQILFLDIHTKAILDCKTEMFNSEQNIMYINRLNQDSENK